VSESVDPFDLVKAEELMRGYHYRWKDESFEVVGVESEFTTPLRNPATGARSRTWQLGGKMDVRVRRGSLGGFVEHKTATGEIGPGSEYMRRLQLDPQVSIYFEGGAALGPRDDDRNSLRFELLGERDHLVMTPLSDQDDPVVGFELPHQRGQKGAQRIDPSQGRHDKSEVHVGHSPPIRAITETPLLSGAVRRTTS